MPNRITLNERAIGRMVMEALSKMIEEGDGGGEDKDALMKAISRELEKISEGLSINKFFSYGEDIAIEADSEKTYRRKRFLVVNMMEKHGYSFHKVIEDGEIRIMIFKKSWRSGQAVRL